MNSQPPPPKPSKLIMLVKVLAPFIPVVIGVALKLSILDAVPKESGAQMTFLINNYARPLWLQLLVSAYILPIAAIMSGMESRARIAALYVIPAVVFLVCLFLVLGLRNFGIASNFWQILVPDIVAGICVIILGIILVNTPPSKG